MRVGRSRATTAGAFLLIGALSGSTGPVLAQIDSELGALPSASDPLVDAYERLYGSGRMLAQETPASGRPESRSASEASGHASMEAVNKQLNNPVSSLWSLNFQNNFVISTGSPSDRE